MQVVASKFLEISVSTSTGNQLTQSERKIRGITVSLCFQYSITEQLSGQNGSDVARRIVTEHLGNMHSLWESFSLHKIHAIFSPSIKLHCLN